MDTKTNADRIRNMTDEELAEVVHGRKIEDGDIGGFGCALCAANGCRMVRTIAQAAAEKWIWRVKNGT